MCYCLPGHEIKEVRYLEVAFPVNNYLFRDAHENVPEPCLVSNNKQELSCNRIQENSHTPTMIATTYLVAVVCVAATGGRKARGVSGLRIGKASSEADIMWEMEL